MNRIAAVLTTYMGVTQATVEPLHVNGLIAAVVTPMNADTSLNLDVVAQQAAYLHDTGVEHVFVGGTTGEGASLTVNERMDLVEAWEAAGPSNGVNYIVHVGAESILDVIKVRPHNARAQCSRVRCSPLFLLHLRKPLLCSSPSMLQLMVPRP